jgi:3-deoxy-7-phosphoheptulonate synthase
MQPHHFLSVTKEGKSAISATSGNEDCHIILRGGNGSPNYSPADVEAAVQELAKSGLPGRLMIDCSHANSGKDFRRQSAVAAAIAAQLKAGEARIIGAMLESNIVEGRQDIVAGAEKNLVYGQSITDACVGWEETADILSALAEAVRARRSLLEQKD